MSNVATSPAFRRIESLLDEHSFVELGALVTSRSTDFNSQEQKAPSDGVVIGHGTVDGNLVFVYSQDAGVMGGSVGEMHARKICQLYEMAVKVGAPVIGLLDSTGIRLQESIDALDAVGRIYASAVAASGVIPQLTAVFGNCGGGLGILTSISDFTFIEEGARLFINSANAIPGNSEETLDTASASFQFEVGNADGVGSEEEILSQIRSMISLVPGSNLQEGEVAEATDDLNRAAEGLDVKRDDARAVAAELADQHVFFETRAGYAKEMTTGFIRLGGITVGIFGNTQKCDDQDDGNQLTVNGAYKAADFVRFCDAFDIPLLSLTNVASYEASLYAEKALGQAAARLIYALASASVPKINVITKKAVGTAFLAMNAKSVGADLTFALPDAQIEIMDASLAAQVMYASADQAEQTAQARAFAEKQSGVIAAAGRGLVDRIVAPEDLRKYLIAGFEMLLGKREDFAFKKHGTK